jgi:2-polyprenyl-3-methyl-5-hydroxy-6-metoxy-1,4-benzoquinol methylase
MEIKDIQSTKLVFGESEFFTNSDYIRFNASTFAVKPWNISKFFNFPLTSIRCFDTLEYMTSMEVDSCLTDWNRALAIGGNITLQVPDVDYFAKMWLEAEWTEANLRSPSSAARRSRSGLYGVQSKGNPKMDDYDPSYSDVVKTPFNERKLSFLMQRAGFAKLIIERPANGKILAKAVKSMDKAERQVAPELEQIRADHRKRYEFAAKHMNNGDTVLDFACGIGYGSKIISNMGLAEKITACDINHDALEYAEHYYSSHNIKFIYNDALEAKLPKEKFDLAISFETVEHLSQPSVFLKAIYESLKKNGTLICSVPNQDMLPFKAKEFPYHFRHYKAEELQLLMSRVGFSNICFYSQKDRIHGEIERGPKGLYLIAKANKNS